MRHLFLTIVLIIHSSFKLQAQFQEVQVGIGTANYYGDLNNTNKSIIQPLSEFNSLNLKASYSIGYQYHLKEYFSIGAQISAMSLSAYDSDNYSKGFENVGYARYLRNLSFYTDLYELSTQFTFEPYRNDKRWFNYRWFASPYISAGVGIFTFNPKTILNGTEYELQPLGTEGQGLSGQKDKYNLTQISFPISLGLKVYSPNRRIAISMDFSYRLTTTDYIDDVSSNYYSKDLFDLNYNASTATLVKSLSDRRIIQSTSNDYIRGNQNDNDGFITMQMKFSYFFNHKREVKKPTFIFVNPRYLN